MKKYFKISPNDLGTRFCFGIALGVGISDEYQNYPPHLNQYVAMTVGGVCGYNRKLDQIPKNIFWASAGYFIGYYGTKLVKTIF